MRRPPLPAFMGDLFVDPVAKGALIAGSLSPCSRRPSTRRSGVRRCRRSRRRSARTRELETDRHAGLGQRSRAAPARGRDRRLPARPADHPGRPARRAARAAPLPCFPSGPIFIVARLVGHASATFVIPVSIALVATSYRGPVRATAIGLAYGAYGAGGAAAPILLQVVPGEQLARLPRHDRGLRVRRADGVEPGDRAAPAVPGRAVAGHRGRRVGLRDHHPDRRADLDRRRPGQSDPLGDDPGRTRPGDPVRPTERSGRSVQVVHPAAWSWRCSWAS